MPCMAPPEISCCGSLGRPPCAAGCCTGRSTLQKCALIAESPHFSGILPHSTPSLPQAFRQIPRRQDFGQAVAPTRPPLDTERGPKSALARCQSHRPPPKAYSECHIYLWSEFGARNFTPSPLSGRLSGASPANPRRSNRRHGVRENSLALLKIG